LPSWHWTMILLISTSQVATISGLSHHLLILIIPTRCWWDPEAQEERAGPQVLRFSGDGPWAESFMLLTDILLWLSTLQHIIPVSLIENMGVICSPRFSFCEKTQIAFWWGKIFFVTQKW
jgi:hypothetical protein